MIYLIGKPTEWRDDYMAGTFDQFFRWIVDMHSVEFDIETNVTPWWYDKKVITVQFGNAADQWVMQWSMLTDQQRQSIKEILESKKIEKLIHNALFECTVMLFNDIRVQNVYDTMLAEMVLNGGADLGAYGLDDCCFKYLDVILDKTEQTTFGDNILTPNKVVYAAQDVKYLYRIKFMQGLKAVELKYDTFDKVVELENSIVPAFSEMVYHGMEVDKDWWIGLVREAEPLVAAALEKLNTWLLQEPFRTKALEMGFISEHDRVLINWNSPKQKDRLFKEFYPQIPGTTKAVVKKWMSMLMKAGEEYPEWCPYYLEGNTDLLEKEIIANHWQWLVDEQLLIPALTPSINWNSTVQVLPLVQLVEKVSDLSAESLGRTSHLLIADYEEFKDTAKLLSSFGEKWLQKYVEPDGKVRTRFRQVLETGRTSSSAPNQQQLPKNEKVGNKYRNAFILPKGWSWVSGDFVSEELVIITHLSKEKVWEEALAKGEDLHSRVSEVVFGKKWIDATETGCAYYKRNTNGEISKQKCKCKRHKGMRDITKVLNFMLAYGGSHFKLASTLRIPVQEAKKIIEDYFKVLPQLKKTLDYLGNFGVQNGYIQTIYPYYRRRFFPNHIFYTRFIDGHISGVQYHPGLGEIQRASMNMPIQGTGGEILKVSMFKLYNYIHDNNLSDKVHMIMEVHDSIECAVRDDYTAEWSIIQSQLMEDAAKVLIPSGILKTDISVTERWS